MAEAILSRLITVGTYAAGQVIVSDPVASRCRFLEEHYGVISTDQNQRVVEAPTVLLAIKPQVWKVAVQDLTVPADRLIISILAGVTIDQLEQITAISQGSKVSAEQYQVAANIFNTVGKVIAVGENQLDAVTGLSGSGPAYVAIMIEALADGGVAAGLPRATAQQLALQTVLGTAHLLAESDLHPAICKDRVTSPGGTTIAGIRALEQGGFRSTIMEAVLAATDRSRELSS
jgi:pyrroline-5-carboxylate reductase